MPDRKPTPLERMPQILRIPPNLKLPMAIVFLGACVLLGFGSLAGATDFRWGGRLSLVGSVIIVFVTVLFINDIICSWIEQARSGSKKESENPPAQDVPENG